MLCIHSHLLYGIDDGARTKEEAIQMARGLVAAGITEMIVTPHFEEGLYYNMRKIILEKCAQLRQDLLEAEISLVIHPGCEVMLTPEVLDRLQNNELMTMKDQGQYLLVELPLSQYPVYTKDLLYEIKIRGYIPILAHPERYHRLPPEIIEDNLVQINLPSLAGLYGSRIQEKAELIMADKPATEILFGTDAHRLQTDLWHPELMENLKKNERFFAKT